MRVVLFLCIISNMCCGAEIDSAPFFFEYHIADQSRRELIMHVWVPSPEKRYPLILFSHGLGKAYNGMTYTHLCQSIATRGYVVASVSHVPIQQNKHMFDVVTEVWVADMVSALNECIQRNTSEDDFLYNKIDVSRIGIMGHSLGGSTALQVCRRDKRVAVTINLDGPLYGHDAMAFFDKPMLFIFGSSVMPGQMTAQGKVPYHYAFLWRDYFNKKWLPVLNKFIASSPAIEVITIDGIVHDTFTDYACTPDPIIQPWLIDGAYAQAMINSYIVEFLEKNLFTTLCIHKQ